MPQNLERGLGSEGRVAGTGVAIVNRVVGRDLTKKVALELRYRGGEEARWLIQGQDVLGRGGQPGQVSSTCLSNSQEARVRPP